MHCPFHHHPAQHVRPQGVRTQPLAPAPSGDFDPNLLKPVAFQPPPPMSASTRAQLKSERGCLERELAATQRAIDHLNDQLAA
jgi:hypothetical protein